MSNTTHRKRLARALSAETDLSYAQALDVVIRSSEAGNLPSRLDETGLQAALRILKSEQTSAPEAASPAPPACPHPTTEYRAGEGTVCDRCGTVLTSYERYAAAEAFYLDRQHLAALRLAWQGRVAVEHRTGGRGAAFRHTVDDHPASTGVQDALWWLRENGYVESPSMHHDDEWATVRLTAWGEDVLAANGADVQRFHDGLPPGVGQD